MYLKVPKTVMTVSVAWYNVTISSWYIYHAVLQLMLSYSWTCGSIRNWGSSTAIPFGKCVSSDFRLRHRNLQFCELISVPVPMCLPFVTHQLAVIQGLRIYHTFCHADQVPHLVVSRWNRNWMEKNFSLIHLQETLKHEWDWAWFSIS